jgi:hypothetical protein
VVLAEEFVMAADDLQTTMGLEDLQRIDLELDHLKNLGLIQQGFVSEESHQADVTP